MTILAETPSHDATQLQWSHYICEFLGNFHWRVPSPERIGLLVNVPLCPICIIAFAALVGSLEGLSCDRSLAKSIPRETAATAIVFVGATSKSFSSVFCGSLGHVEGMMS